MVIRYGCVGVTVKFREPVNILPDSFVVRMEDMGTVLMSLEPLACCCVNLAANMVPFVNYQDPLAGIRGLPGKDRAKQSCADN